MSDGSREIHIGCSGAVVLTHEVWRCQKCRKAPMSILETKTVYEVATAKKARR